MILAQDSHASGANGLIRADRVAANLHASAQSAHTRAVTACSFCPAAIKP